MRVHNEGQIRLCVFDSGNKVIHALRCADTGHILNADGRNTHRSHLIDELDIVCERMDRACRIGNCTGSHSAGLHRLFNGHLEIIHVIEGVENSDDINSVADRCPDKTPNNIIRVVLIAKNVLAAQKHLQLGVGHVFTNLAETLPRILIQEAQANVKRGTAPDFAGIKTRFIHRVEDRLHLVIAEPRGNQALACVTQGSLGKTDFLFFHRDLQ